MRNPAAETIHEQTADASSADLAEHALFADPKTAACLDRLDARWSKPKLAFAEPVLQRLGRFEIRRELGRGRFGVVFLAWDPQLQRQVALKVPQFDAALDAELRERFRGEALSAGKLQHAGIVPVFEVGQHAGVDYLAMAYIDGETLAERLQNGPLPPADAARLTIGLATAIHHAHEQGVIHRDLKPSNVLLDKQERPHVTDFGLARRLSDSAMRATATGQVLGTPAYMPPEQATGRGDIGPASDVYSIGVILYETITGRPPFQAATFVEAVEFILNRDPLPPSKLNPKLPKELDAITFKCLEKREEARYASAADLADDLQRYLDGRPIRARAQGPAQHALRWARKNPAYALLLVTLLVAVALLITTAGIYDRWQHATELAEQEHKIADQQRENAAAQEQIAKTQTQIAETERQRAAAERKAATTARYFGTVNRARNVITRRLPGWSAASLAEIKAAAATHAAEGDQLELRALAAESLTGLDVEQTAKFNAGMLIGRIAISADGQLLAVGELKGSTHCRVKVYQLPEQQPKHEFTILNVGTNITRLASGEPKWQDGVREFAFSSDSRYLAAGMRFGKVFCFDLQAPEKPPRQLTVSKERELELLAFSADGQSLFALTNDDEFLRWQRWQTDVAHDSPWSQRPVSFAVPSLGHELYVQNSATEGLWVLDQNLQKRTYFSNPAELPEATETKLVTDSTGALLAGKTVQGVRLYETRTGYSVRRLQDDTVIDGDLGYNLALTADGQLLSAFDRDGIVRLFDVQRGRQVLRMDIGRHEFQDMVLDPQGKWLAVANDDSLVVWHLNRSAVRRVLTSPAMEVQDIRFSSQGVLACAAKNGGAGGREQFHLLTFESDGSPRRVQSGGYEHCGHFAGDTQVAWLPDGNRLVWSGKFGARVVPDALPAAAADRSLSLLGDVLPVDWSAVAAVEDEAIEVRQLPHPHLPERPITQVVPGGHDVKLKCRLPRPVKAMNQVITLSISLRIDGEPSALPVFQLHQRYGEQQFPSESAAPWAISSRGGDFSQWSVELVQPKEFAEFELLITHLDGVRAIEIANLEFVALALQPDPIRRIVQQLNFLAVSPSGDRLWGCIDERVHSWSLETGKQLSTWQNPQHALNKAGNVRCLVAGERGTLVGTRDGGVYWLDPSKGTTQAGWSGPGKEVVAAALCEQAGCALVAADNGKVRALQLSGGETLFEWVADDSAVVAIAATADAQTLVTASTNRTLRLWRLVLNPENKPVGYQLYCQLPDTVVPVKSLALSPNGQRLAVLTTITGSVALWDLPALNAEFQRLGIE